MDNSERKGITVRIDAALHAEVSRFIRDNGMTMGEFVSLALDNELHPKYKTKEDEKMENTRTIAFQVPEELFHRIKEYLARNKMTQRQFLLGLIEDELEREQKILRKPLVGAQDAETTLTAGDTAQGEEASVEPFVAECEASVPENVSRGFVMGMAI